MELHETALPTEWAPSPGTKEDISQRQWEICMYSEPVFGMYFWHK